MASNNIGMVWLYCLVVLFVLGIIQLLILPAIEAKLIPVLISSQNTTMSPADLATYSGQVANVLHFMDISVYVLMFVVIVFAIVSIFKKEEVTQYQQP
jgi:ascorbate-specific PTS system EIIC-type component UlaA